MSCDVFSYHNGEWGCCWQAVGRGQDAAMYPPRCRKPPQERLILTKDGRYFCLSTKEVLHRTTHLVPTALKYDSLHIKNVRSFHYINYLHKLRLCYNFCITFFQIWIIQNHIKCIVCYFQSIQFRKNEVAFSLYYSICFWRSPDLALVLLLVISNSLQFYSFL